MATITDWMGREVEIATSKRGVLALAQVRENLLEGPSSQWPPAPIVQKLYRSRQEHAFLGADLDAATKSLGYYCDLQSIHSEDAITWSFFGTMNSAVGESSIGVLNWICDTIDVPGGNERCAVSLWRRIPHPDTLVSGGPELDFLILGDKTVIVGEAKWRSGEGTGQGKSGNKTQLQLRREYLQAYGERVFGNRALVVLSVALTVEQLGTVDEQQGVMSRVLTWANLGSCSNHPLCEEYSLYFAWKLRNSKP